MLEISQQKDVIRAVSCIDRLMQGNYTVTLIEGDGIGPEISESVKDIFAAAKVRHGFLV